MRLAEECATTLPGHQASYSKSWGFKMWGLLGYGSLIFQNSGVLNQEELVSNVGSILLTRYVRLRELLNGPEPQFSYL